MSLTDSRGTVSSHAGMKPEETISAVTPNRLEHHQQISTKSCQAAGGALPPAQASLCWVEPIPRGRITVSCRLSSPTP